MTRVIEALARADLVPVTSQDTTPAEKSGDAVLRTWHFDTNDDTPSTARPRPPLLRGSPSPG
jgi:hypothetical protein